MAGKDRLAKKVGLAYVAVYILALILFTAAKLSGDSQWIDTPWLAAPFIALFVTAVTGWLPVIAIVQCDTIETYERI